MEVAAVEVPRSLRRRPAIAADRCVGCGLCVEACPHGCLELVWSFATLIRPEACTGEGACVAACPEGLIEMKESAGSAPERPAAMPPCRPAEDPATGVHGDGDPLLLDLLGPLLRSGETPLQCGIDSLGIAQWALRRRRARLSAEAAALPLDPATLPRRLDAAIRRALGDAPERAVEPPAGRTVEGVLAAWLERLHVSLRGLHPRAAAILAQRVEHVAPREIAERLGLGLRLVLRTLDDLHRARIVGADP